jgi:precorrin-6Y C5,15-methyltransferase (decarboxylating)
MADRVTVIGWDGSPLEPAALAALRAATLVAAAPRHLRLPGVPATAERVQLGSVAVAARRIATHRGSPVVIADGDPGFFGVVRALRDPAHGLEVEVRPAVSAVAAGFARAGMPWDDAQVVVAGRRTLRRAVNVCRAHPKVAVLTAPGAGPAEIALLLRGVHRTFVVCESLGTSAERVTVLTSDRVAERRWTDPNMTIVLGASEGSPTDGWRSGLDPAVGRGPRGWGLEPAAYGLDDRVAPLGPGSASRMRAAQLAVLGPGPGDLLWDIGSGSGLAAVEAARLGSAVIAVDRDAAACARGAAAARRAGVQLQTVHGVAPQILADLPEPDVIRIGGGGRRTLVACAHRRPQRIVTHAITRDEAESAGRELGEAGYEVRCTLLQSVDMDTHNWSERSRSVAFLLSGSRM